jgi:predicted component of type VI protein secretion system
MSLSSSFSPQKACGCKDLENLLNTGASYPSAMQRGQQLPFRLGAGLHHPNQEPMGGSMRQLIERVISRFEPGYEAVEPGGSAKNERNRFRINAFCSWTVASDADLFRCQQGEYLIAR